MREFSLKKMNIAGKFTKNGTRVYIDREFYSVKDILKIVRTKKTIINQTINKKEYVIINGRRCKITSQRLELFAKSLTCVKCGAVGGFFSLERTKRDTNPHLNLYFKNDEGDFVMMTKDHIVPKSKGGKDWMSNYQTMCYPCNQAKGSNIE